MGGVQQEVALSRGWLAQAAGPRWKPGADVDEWCGTDADAAGCAGGLRRRVLYSCSEGHDRYNVDKENQCSSSAGQGWQ